MASTSTFPNLHEEASARTVVPGCRCLLVQGGSATREMTFAGEEPRTQRVGAGPECEWWLEGCEAPDTALVLHWDGDLLWVADSLGHGRATVDGEPLGGRWRGLGGSCRLAFPGGALLVECSRPGVVVEVEPRTSLTPPQFQSDVREVLYPPQLSVVSEAARVVSSLGDEPTRPRASPSLTLQGMGPGERAATPRVSNATIPLSEADILSVSPHRSRKSGPLPTEDTTRTRRRRRSSGT